MKRQYLSKITEIDLINYKIRHSALLGNKSYAPQGNVSDLQLECLFQK